MTSAERIKAVSDERADELRATVPDDPHPLPPNSLACESCGIAVEHAPFQLGFTRAAPMPGVVTTVGVPPRFTDNPAVQVPMARFDRCPSCTALHDHAMLYVAERPALVGKYGSVITEHIEGVLLGLAVLGQPIPDDLAFVLPRFHHATHAIRFRNPADLQVGLCNRWPFAHLSLKQRAALKLARVEVMRDRLALREPPVRVPCPSGGCRLCGLAAIEKSAIEVTRRGGVQATAFAVWESVPRGHACPNCVEAVQKAGGLGRTAVEWAVLNYLRRTNERKSRRLLTMLDDDLAPRLVPWFDSGAIPNDEPFAHLRKVLERL